MTHSSNPCLKVLSFGEILWDIIGEREMIGGAPFNVAAHLARLGVQSCIYSRIGSDRRGSLARHRLLRVGVRDNWLQVDHSRPTGWVDVTLNSTGQPSYSIGANSAWDALELPAPQMAGGLVAENFSALVCGTLAQRSPGNQRALAAIRALLPGVPVFYDVNLRGSETPFEIVRATLPGVSIVKLNEAEAEIMGFGLCGRSCDLADLFTRLFSDFGTKLLICTKGSAGSSIHSAEGRLDVPSVPVVVASAVGAGDAFSAAFLAGWLQGRPLAQVIARANLLGGFVASRHETVPEYSRELLARLEA